MTKNGMGGHGKENYDPKTGKFIEDGVPNKYHPNPNEQRAIDKHIPAKKIQDDSAKNMSSPLPNLGDYAKPKAEPSRNEVLKKEFDVEPQKYKNETHYFDSEDEIDVFDEGKTIPINFDKYANEDDQIEFMEDLIGRKFTEEERNDFIGNWSIPKELQDMDEKQLDREYSDFIFNKYRDKISRDYQDYWKDDRDYTRY